MLKSTACLEKKTKHKNKTQRTATTTEINNQINTPEILNMKTNSKATVQMASMIQAERKTKWKTTLEGTSNVWGFGFFLGRWWCFLFVYF